MRALPWTIAGLAAVLETASVFAQGCGPTRLKVVASVEIAAAPDKVWALVADFQDLRWDVEAVSVVGKGGNVPERATRAVTLRDGTELAESLYKYDAAGMSYAYHLDRVDLDRLPVQNASATLEVVPLDGGNASAVRWKMAFYRNLVAGEGAPDAADARAVEAVKRLLHAGLEGLRQKAPPRS